MRITVRLDEDLLREAQSRATASGRTLDAVLEEALRDALLRPEPSQHPDERVRLTTFGGEGRGLLPGVDLDDSASLLDLMEGRS